VGSPAPAGSRPVGTPAAGSRPSPGNLAAAGRRREVAGRSSSSFLLLLLPRVSGDRIN
jgi:hypothetical protein